MKLRYHLILIFLIVANIYDVYSTHIIVGDSLHYELNPIARAAIYHTGYWGFLFVKMFLLVLIWGLLFHHFRKATTIPRITSMILYTTVVAYAIIGVHNFSVLLLINR